MKTYNFYCYEEGGNLIHINSYKAKDKKSALKKAREGGSLLMRMRSGQEIYCITTSNMIKLKQTDFVGINK